MSVRGSVGNLARAFAKSLYYRLPASICYGPEYEPTLRLLAESQTWDAGRLAEYQLGKLKAILRHAAAHVPYYRRLFREVGFDPERVRDASDLRALPLLDKETIRENLSDLVAENVPERQRFYFTTGGTTGLPLGFYNMRSSGGRERAFAYT